MTSLVWLVPRSVIITGRINFLSLLDDRRTCFWRPGSSTQRARRDKFRTFRRPLSSQRTLILRHFRRSRSSQRTRRVPGIFGRIIVRSGLVGVRMVRRTGWFVDGLRGTVVRTRACALGVQAVHLSLQRRKVWLVVSRGWWVSRFGSRALGSDSDGKRRAPNVRTVEVNVNSVFSRVSGEEGHFVSHGFKLLKSMGDRLFAMDNVYDDFPQSSGASCVHCKWKRLAWHRTFCIQELKIRNKAIN